MMPPSDPVEPTCETVETGENMCVPEVTDCTDNGDCPGGWKCHNEPMSKDTPVPDCAPGEDCGGSDGFAPREEPQDPAGICLPDDWDDWAGAYDGDYSGGTPVGGTVEERDNTSKGGSDHQSTGGIFGCSSGHGSAPWLVFLMLIPFFLIRKGQEA